MNQTSTLPATQEESPETIAAIKAELERYALEWEELKQQMLLDKEASRQLRMETRANIAQLQEQINRL